MGEDVLVDMIINDPSGNKVIIVGRPKLLGSASRQMRHVTPYSFVEHAIKSIIMSDEIQEKVKKRGYLDHVIKLVEVVKPLISAKKGICLSQTEYDELLSIVDVESEKSQSIAFNAMTKKDVQNKYYLIYNEEVVEQFKLHKDFEDIKDKTEKLFHAKLSKYIKGGVTHLTDKLLNHGNPTAITVVCEGIARVILTLFNQDKYAAFPEEGNSLLEEIRVYQDARSASDAKRENKKIHEQMRDKIFNVVSHSEIVQRIQDGKQKDYDFCIRIVNNEGKQTINASNALKLLNFLVNDKLYGHPDTGRDDYSKYNNEYNFKIKINKLSNDYNIDLDGNNLEQIFHYHVAKYLYLVFDFKPLELQVLAPKQGKEKEEDIVKVYPSATGIKSAEYSVQEGSEYRKLQYNARKGYNDKAVFRSEMRSEEVKQALIKKIVSHVIISLIPFRSIKAGLGQHNNGVQGMKEVFQAFVDLVKCDYNDKAEQYTSGMMLDDEWEKHVKEEYENNSAVHTFLRDTNVDSVAPSVVESSNYNYM